MAFETFNSTCPASIWQLTQSHRSDHSVINSDKHYISVKWGLVYVSVYRQWVRLKGDSLFN